MSSPIESSEIAAPDAPHTNQPREMVTAENSEVRTGSPFAAPPDLPPPAAEAADFDAGVAAETARGGVLAAWLLVPFALGTVWGFPLGGVLIAGLGNLLSLSGLASPRPYWALTTLLIHFILLAIASLEWLEVSIW